MKPDNWNRFAAGLLAILLCLCSFSMPAFASGSDPAPEPLPEIIEEEPTTGGMEPEGVPITPKGNATLVDDFYGDKQLTTVTTKAGNYFYQKLKECLLEQFRILHDEKFVRTFFVGGALGVDMWAGEQLLTLRAQTGYEDIKIVVVVPFIGYDSKWPDQSR